MKYYAAVGDKRELSAVVVTPPVRALFSYFYYKNKIHEIHEFLNAGHEAFLDSGAFSVHNAGATVNIDDYCKFVIASKCPIFAGLDVIGNAEATKMNTKYMFDNYGLKAIPTFHMGSSLNDLEELVHGNYSYIALGGLAFAANTINHCDAVWHYILTHNPKLRVHGFGLTNLVLMERYPWYSIDSSSYNSCKRYGRQNILWNGLNMITVTEKKFWAILETMGYKNVEGMTNNERYMLYDMHSSQAYKLYVEHLGDLNKSKDFSYLTAQLKLF